MLRTLWVALLSLWLGYAQALTLDDIQGQGYITVAVYQDLPPYSYLVAGQAQGVDVALAQAIADGLQVGLKLQWIVADESLDDDLRNHVWKGHYLRRKQIADLMLRVPYDRAFSYKVDHEGIVINDTVHMFAPYQKESWAIAYDRQQIAELDTLARLQYDQVGVEIDSLPDFFLSGIYGGRLRSQVQHFMSTQAAVEAMSKQQVAAVMGTQSQLLWGVSSLQGSYALHQRLLQTLVKPKWDIGMAVKDAHRRLAYAITEIVDKMVVAGEMQEIYNRYQVTYEKPDMYR